MSADSLICRESPRFKSAGNRFSAQSSLAEMLDRQPLVSFGCNIGSSLFGRIWSRALIGLVLGFGAARGAVLLFGISRMALPAWDQYNETEQSDSRADRRDATVQEPKANSSRPSSREGPPPLNNGCLDRASHYCAAGVASRVQRNSVPSLHMRCMTTASRRAKATIAFCCPRRLAICMAHALSQDHFWTRVSMTCAAS